MWRTPLAIALAAALGCSSAKESGNGASADPGTAATTTGNSTTNSAQAGDGDGDSKGTMSKHQANYEALFTTDKPGTVQRHTGIDIGDWQFFHYSESDRPGGSKYRAAVDSDGNAVGGLVKAKGWHAFLTADGMDAAKAHSRIGWLYTAGMLADADKARMKDDKLKALISDPVLETRDDGTVVFRGWYARGREEPELMVIEAPASGEPTVTKTPWHKVEK